MNSIVAEDVRAILAAPLPWSQLAGKTVLITGAGGFLPSWFVHTLTGLNDLGRQAPCRIIAVVRSKARSLTRLKPYQGRADLEVIEADVCDPLPTAERLDVIIHAASPAAPRAYLADPVGTLRVNLVATANLLDRARHDGSGAFLYLSSGEVYGETGNVMIAEQDYGYLDPATVRACYGEGKRAAETMCVAWSAQHFVPTRIVRPMHTYGPGIDLGDGRVFSDFVGDILARRDIVLKSDGMARRPFCYVADATVGFFTVLLTGETATPYNVGNDQTVITIRDLARTLVEDAFPDRGLKVVHQGPAGADLRLLSPISGGVPDISRMRQLGWAPTTGLVDGFRRTVASFDLG